MTSGACLLNQCWVGNLILLIIIGSDSEMLEESENQWRVGVTL
jgi:hypothetical protein